MNYFTITLLAFLGIFQLSCAQKQESTTQWLEHNTIDLQPNNAYDFSKLNSILKDKRIVAIGESTHGLGKFYEIKSALVMYLHKELGFDIIAMEGGLGDINLAYRDIDTIAAKNLRDYTLFGNFKAKEIDTLFNHIKNTSKSERPLIYAGYDTQFSSNYFITKMTKLLKPLNKTLADSFPHKIYSFQKAFQASHNNDSINYIKHRDIYINTAKQISTLITTNKEQLITSKLLNDKDYVFIQKTLNMFIQSTDLSYANRFMGYGLRDKLMAENLIWLLEEVYPDKKVIVWAHNGHVEKNFVEGYNTKLMGHFLKEKYGENYYTIGLFAYEGEAYQHWTQNRIPFKNNDSLAIENKLYKTNKNCPFLDMSKLKQTPNTKWLFNVATGFELENGGTINFIPTKRFDAILSVNTYSGIPTY